MNSMDSDVTNVPDVRVHSDSNYEKDSAYTILPPISTHPATRPTSRPDSPYRLHPSVSPRSSPSLIPDIPSIDLMEHL